MLLPRWLPLIAGTWASWKVAGGVAMILGMVVGFCQASWVVVKWCREKRGLCLVSARCLG